MCKKPGKNIKNVKILRKKLQKYKNRKKYQKTLQKPKKISKNSQK